MLNGNPDKVYADMYRNNPQFRQFADSMKGKDPRQAFSDAGYDFDEVRKAVGK